MEDGSPAPPPPPVFHYSVLRLAGALERGPLSSRPLVHLALARVAMYCAKTTPDRATVMTFMQKAAAHSIEALQADPVSPLLACHYAFSRHVIANEVFRLRHPLHPGALPSPPETQRAAASQPDGAPFELEQLKAAADAACFLRRRCDAALPAEGGLPEASDPLFEVRGGEKSVGLGLRRGSPLDCTVFWGEK